MGKKKIAGPGRLGTAKAVRASLKGGGQPNVKGLKPEDSITVRFLDEPGDWHGYYEHYMPNGPLPCTTDDCDGCNSDEPGEQRKQFKYLANAYVVDDQKVWALKLTKTLVDQLMHYYSKYKGTIRDRDYDLSRTGSGQFDTKYMASPDAKRKMDLSRFDKKKFDLTKLLSDLVNDSDDDDDDDFEDEEETPAKKGPRKKRSNPWDDDDEKPKKKKSASGVKKSPVKKTGRVVVKKRSR